jgi:acyl carrier protein
VRMGHKTRQEALEELDDELDLVSVRKMLAEIGYDENRLEGDPRPAGVAAYYVSSRELPDAELRDHLSARLPSPLVPQFFKQIDAIPLTANGKADLAALPAMTGTEDRARDEYVAPAGPVQERLAVIWSEVLRADQVSARRSFFELGGTSLAAMEVMLQLCRQFELDLALQTIFQHPTIEELATAIENQILSEIAALSDEEAERLAKAPHPES